MIPLQAGEIAETIKSVSAIEKATVIGLMLLIIVGLVVFVVYLIRKADKKEEQERQKEIDSIKLFQEIGNSINETKKVSIDVKGTVDNIHDGTKELLIYIKNTGK